MYTWNRLYIYYFSFAFSLLKHVYKEVNCHCSTNDWLKTIEIGNSACMYDLQVWLNNQQAAWEAGSHDEPWAEGTNSHRGDCYQTLCVKSSISRPFCLIGRTKQSRLLRVDVRRCVELWTQGSQVISTTQTNLTKRVWCFL